MAYWDILIAAIVSMILGFTWFGPLFGKQWMKLMNITNKQMKDAKKKGMPSSTWIWMIISTLVTVSILSMFTAPYSMGGAVRAAFWIWLGFIAPIQLGMVLWEGKPWALYFLTTSYYLINIIISALILQSF